MRNGVETRMVQVHTLRPGDKIVRWNGEISVVCQIDVTWEGKAPDYWAQDPVQGRIPLGSQDWVDALVDEKESDSHHQTNKPWWQFWKR